MPTEVVAVRSGDASPPEHEKSALGHLLALAPLRLWVRLILDNGGVPRRYWGKLAGVLATSALTVPVRAVESMRYGPRRLARVEIEPEPLYIQGVARSGTSHLHNILAQDPNFGTVSTFQAFAQPMFLTGRGWLDRAVSKRLPKKRPMDNMAVSLDLPQEEEVALASISHLSSMHQLSFPRSARQYLEKFATMQLTGKEMAQWECAYLTVLRKATLASGGQRLVLKSPTNLGRTTLLLRLFPGAKFIHIVRNPYVVYQSMRNLYRTMLPLCQLQDADLAELETANCLAMAKMMRQFMQDRASIPVGQLAEVRFEDLKSDPIAEVGRLYSELALPDWGRASERVADYLRTVSGYHANAYRIDRETIEIVDRDWGFAVESWGYRPPGPD